MVFDLWPAVSDMSFWLMFLHQTLKVNINSRFSSALFCREKLKAQHMRLGEYKSWTVFVFL